MCGIYGSINNLKPDLNELKNSLNHRGPDGCGDYTYDNIYLYHSRLAIQDLSEKANQPFHYKHYTIIFNGEIYNHQELKKLCDGFDFRTESDTETLIALFIKYKNKMFDFLDGMFALCILDRKSNQLLLVRDRAGKKPLYLFQRNEKLIFSSELNALKTGIPNIEINEEAINAYLRCGFFYKGYTAYKYISEVEPGSFYTIDITSKVVTKKKYFNILDYYMLPKVTNLNEAITTVDQALHKSVKSRLVSSDLEVGAFLSGGIDSSLVVAVAAQYKKKIKTFTVKFDGAYDESALAKLTSNKYCTDHFELRISIDLDKDIEKILQNYGQPFMDSSAIPSYYVSKEAKKHITVVLNGDGADELFGGYRRYVPFANGWLKIASKISFLLNVLPISNNRKSIYNYFTRLLYLSMKGGVDSYLSSTTNIFEDIYKFKSNEIIKKMELFIGENKLNELCKMLYLDFNLILPQNLLVKMDIATMAHSLEARSPFLSKYFLELAPQLDNQLKVNGKVTKYLLRELSKKYLPKTIIKQPKRGFEPPLKKWVNSDLKVIINDSLNGDSYSSSFVNKSFIASLLTDKLAISKERRAKILWNLFSLETWYNNQ